MKKTKLSPEENRARQHVREKAWRELHKEEIKKRRHEYFLTHREISYARDVAWRQAHPDYGKKMYAKWLQAHPDYSHRKNGNYGTVYRAGFKKIVFDHYGNSCVCCGETNDRFLTIDHINGGGSQRRRKEHGTGWTFHKWIIEHNFPNDLRILCYNCNCGKCEGIECRQKKETKSPNKNKAISLWRRYGEGGEGEVNRKRYFAQKPGDVGNGLPSNNWP